MSGLHIEVVHSEFVELLVLELNNFWPDVLDPPGDQTPEEGKEFIELPVVRVTVPAFDWDSIVWLGLEVFLNVVNNDDLS